MEEVRCKKCDKLLCKATTMEGEIKCKGCKHLNEFRVISQKSFYKSYLELEE